MLSCAWSIFNIVISILGLTHAIEHRTNLIWAQSPTIKVFSQSRLVGISGDPKEWVVNRNPQVTYISAPHYTWEFSSMTFHWNDQILYWSEGTFKKIQGLTLNGSRETQTIVSGTSSEVYGIAIDWISRNLYYTDALYNWIMMTSSHPKKAAYRIIVNEGLDSPHGIAVHPLLGRLFWSDWGARPKIETSNLLGYDRRILVEKDVINPKGLTIDYQNDELYWVDAYKTTIESVGLNGEGRTVLHTEEGSSFYGLALYDNYIFATDRSRDGMLKVFNRKQKLVSFTLSSVPHDAVMYDPSRQPGNSTECDDLGCQQLCVADPENGPQCFCGEGYALNEVDGTSCTFTKQFVHPSHIYAIGDSICQYPANLADMSLNNVTLDSQCFLEGRQAYMTLTFDARNHFLYYFGNKTKTISRIPLELGGKGKVMAGGTGIVNGMAYDWTSGNLYWTDTTNGVIRMGAQDCSYQAVILDRLGTPFGIAVHPGRAKIYWTDHGHPPVVGSKVQMANMDGSGFETIMDDSLGTPNHLFIDFVKDYLYWADSRLNHVRRMDLRNGRMSVVFELPSVRFFGISFFQDYLLWTDKDDLNGIHVARMDKKEKIRGIIHPKNGIAADLITFDLQNQPMFNSPCAPNVTKCSQLCVAVNVTHAKCLCGSGYTLADDGFSCTTLPVWDNFLLVNDAYQRQIFQINILTGVPAAVDLKLYHEPIALTYDPFDYKVFWSDNKAHIISEATIEGRYEKIVMRLNNMSMCNGLAADYVNKLLFYTDAGNDVVGVVSMLKNDMIAILVNSDLDDPRDIVVFPHQGTIFWTDWGKKPRIEMAYMDGTKREDLVSFDDKAWPNGLALDASEQNLFWVDAHSDSVNVISLKTRTVKKLLNEEGSHYFSIAVMGDYLYINDWKRNYLVRMDKRGGYIRRYGETKYTRLYGMEGFNSTEAFKGPSVCAASACVHLCLPSENGRYTCRCREGYVFEGMDCIVAPNTTTAPPTTVTATNSQDQSSWTSEITISKRPTVSSTTKPETTSSKRPTERFTTKLETTSSKRPTVSSTTKPETTSSKRQIVSSTTTMQILETTTTLVGASTGASTLGVPVTTSSGDSANDLHAHTSILSGTSGLSSKVIIIIATVVSASLIIIILIIVIFTYRRNRRSFFPHDKLTESPTSSIQKIVYPTRDEDIVTFEGGIENPTYDCLNNIASGSSNTEYH